MQSSNHPGAGMHNSVQHVRPSVLLPYRSPNLESRKQWISSDNKTDNQQWPITKLHKSAYMTASAISERLVPTETLLQQTGPLGFVSPQSTIPESASNNISPIASPSLQRTRSKRPQLCGLVPADPVGQQHFPDSVIVVEGQRDFNALRLKADLNCSILILGGGGNFNDKHPTMQAIKAVALHHNLIVLTDPDPAGRVMRKCIDGGLASSTTGGSLFHAFLPAHLGSLRRKIPARMSFDEDGNPKPTFVQRPKVGIEHASQEAICKALAGRRRPSLTRKEFTREDLQTFGMKTPSNRASRLRCGSLIGSALGFGAVLSRQELLHCLNVWCFSREEVEAAAALAQDELYEPYLQQKY